MRAFRRRDILYALSGILALLFLRAVYLTLEGMTADTQLIKLNWYWAPTVACSVPFDRLEEIQSKKNYGSSTELIHALIESGQLKDPIEEIKAGRLAPQLLRCNYTFGEELKFSCEESLRGVTLWGPAKWRWRLMGKPLPTDVMWTLLVSGYENAPSNMVIAATRNIDLSVPCPEDPEDRSVRIQTGDEAIPFLRYGGAVILKNGEVVLCTMRPSRTKPPYNAVSRQKVYWPASGVAEEEGWRAGAYLKP